RVAEADLETWRAGANGKLRRDGTRKYGVEHERIGGDPADEPAPQTPARSKTHHPSPPRMVVFTAPVRLASQRPPRPTSAELHHRLTNWLAAERCDFAADKPCPSHMPPQGVRGGGTGRRR